MGTFVTKTGADGQFYFNLKANNGLVILTSEGYSTTAAMQNGIDSVKKNATDESKYEKLISSNGKPYFNLKAGNGQVIGKSQLYENDANCDSGIASVKANAPDAGVTEE
jgi:uncharacterized protein YegP (UPF0339 family)